MKFHYLSSSERRPKSDAYIVPCAEEESGGFSYLCSLSEDMLRVVTPLEKTKDFTAKKGEMIVLYSETVSTPRIILLGFGKVHNIDAEVLREVYAKLMTSLASKEYVSIVSALPALNERAASKTLLAMMEGMFFGSYQFTKYRVKEGSYPEVYVPYDSMEEFLQVKERASILMHSMAFARDMINMNADEIFPQGFCDHILSHMPKGLSATVYDEKWLQKERMNLLLGVGQGSATPPRMLVLEWKPVKDMSDHTILIGKGITFDSGGLNMKPTGSIETMRGDMAGAASVAAVIFALAQWNVQKNVTAVMPLAENSVSAKSFKPGDVLRARSGLSVEITNTDAEGRLVLADALDWARTTLQPSRLIDVATLTGACEVALGTDLFGLFCNSDAMAFELEKAAKRAGESLWRLPLYGEYQELLKSDFADCKNASTGRSAGAISGALFLEKFVDKLPWAHLDIAGTSYSKEAKKYYGKGATGSSIRTLIEFLVA